MYVPIVYGFLPEINVFVFVFVFVTVTVAFLKVRSSTPEPLRAKEWFHVDRQI